VVISSTAKLGATIIRRGHAIQTGIGGTNNSIQRYYDILPTNNNNLKATVRISYFDAELNGLAENNLYQWKTKNNITWDLVGAGQTGRYCQHRGAEKYPEAGNA
jgi:hypothetical protein